MSTSKNTFTQVRDILKKIDQSIDSARAKRIREEKSPSERDSQRSASDDQRCQSNDSALARETHKPHPGRAMPKPPSSAGGSGGSGGAGDSENPFQRRVG